jgi:hypothetical protein
MPTSNEERNVQIQVQELQDIVSRLLRYAVSDANRVVTEDILKKTVPLLNKPIDQFTPENEAVLWSVYNSLSSLVTPATNESLWLKEQVEHDDRDQVNGTSKHYSPITRAYLSSYLSFTIAGFIFGLLFFLLQSYTYILSDSLNQVDRYYADISTIDNQITTAKQANPNQSIDEPPLKDLLVKQQVLRIKIKNHYNALQRLNFLWGFIYCNNPVHPDNHDLFSCQGEKSNKDPGPTPINIYQEKPPDQTTVPVDAKSSPGVDDIDLVADAGIATFFVVAKSILRICNYVALPFFTGLLGSLAFVIRAILESLSRSSLTLGFRRRGIIRIFLGGLLGLISGIVIAPDIDEFKKISYSPLVSAFLMGYSVEFAFGVFDALIERGRRALDAIRDPTTVKIANNTSDNNVK